MHGGVGASGETVRDGLRRAEARARARRHSSRVRWMRWLVPGTGALLLLATVAMIAASNYLDSLGLGTVRLSSEGLVMDSPELSGHDGDRSYRVSATRAIQRITDPRIIDLEEITAELRLSAEQEVRLEAVRGTYDSTAETLSLAGGITVSTNDGETGRLESLEAELKTGTIWSEDSLMLTSSFGSLSAGAMRFDEAAGALIFGEGIRMTVHPSKGETRP